MPFLLFPDAIQVLFPSDIDSSALEDRRRHRDFVVMVAPVLFLPALLHDVIEVVLGDELERAARFEDERAARVIHDVDVFPREHGLATEPMPHDLRLCGFFRSKGTCLA